MTTKERKTVRNFQGVPKNLRHVSSLGGWVRATGGKKEKKKLLIGQQKQTEHTVPTHTHTHPMVIKVSDDHL